MRRSQGDRDTMQIVISITAILLAAAYPLCSVGRKNGHPPPLSLSAVVLSVAALELFDLLALLRPDGLYFWKKFSLAVEALFPPAWLWFSLTYGRHRESRSIPLTQRLLLATSPLFLAATLFLPATTFIYSPDFSSEKALFLGNAGFAFYLLLLIYLVIALVNLETTLANTDHISRWKIKFELLGAGMLLAFMVFYYSQGLLFRTINMYLVPARTVVLIVALAMMGYSRLVRGNGVKVCVSPQMAYRSTVLFVVGAYLIGLGLAGVGMRHFGDGFQRAMMTALSFMVGAGLVVILLSETVKRKLRVLIHKHFYENKYDYRDQWLRFTDRLSSSTDREGLLRSIVMGVCDTFGMGNGALFLLDQDEESFKQVAEVAMDSGSVTFHGTDPFMASFVNGKWVVDLRKGAPECASDEQRAFCQENALSFAIPLCSAGRMEGFIAIGKPFNENEAYNFEDLDLMKTLARQASATILNLRLSDQLAHSREMAAIGKVSTFVVHDLKNLVSAVSLMLENAQGNIANPEFQTDMFASLAATVTKMKVLISRLKKLPDKESLRRAPVDLLQLARDTSALVKGGRLNVIGVPVIAEVDRDEFQKVALNLMLNAVVLPPKSAIRS